MGERPKRQLHPHVQVQLKSCAVKSSNRPCQGIEDRDRLLQHNARLRAPGHIAKEARSVPKSSTPSPRSSHAAKQATMSAQ